MTGDPERRTPRALLLLALAVFAPSPAHAEAVALPPRPDRLLGVPLLRTPPLELPSDCAGARVGPRVRSLVSRAARHPDAALADLAALDHRFDGDPGRIGQVVDRGRMQAG